MFVQEAEFRPDRERQSAGLLSILSRPEAGLILVLRDGPGVVGMVSLLFMPSTALGGRVAILEDMVVRPNARGRGAGSRLLHAAVEFAHMAGCRRITLLTDADNAAAQQFYGRHGFRRSAMIPMRLVLNGEIAVVPDD